MIYTTLNRIRAHRPCEDGWALLLHGLEKTSADDEPLSFEKIVELNGISDALWCARAEPQHAQFWRLYAVWCARRVVHLADNPVSTAALLDVAERHALGQATDKELADTEAAYWAANDASWAANDASGAATYAAWAAKAAWAACWAAYYAAEAAHAAEREAQTEEFIRRLRNHKEDAP